MSRRRKDPLRNLTDPERAELTRLSRSAAAPAAQVAHAVALLAVAGGSDYQQAARAAGRRSGDAGSHLVARFNREGLPAVEPRHGGGKAPAYGDAERRRILREADRVPTPAADGLPKVSTYTIWRTLREAGRTYQRTRTWCPTGTAARRRKAGPVVVTDPDAGPKKS